MKLDFIPLGKLSVSRTNMRHTRRAPDVTDLLPTIRTRGVLLPLLVRPSPAPRPVEGPDQVGGAALPTGCFEIVAGARRFTAARIVHDERAAAGQPTNDAIACAILDDGDDADAVEASMIENMARQDADEVTQWESFTRLVREGRGVAAIAATFGLPELAVRRVLALGNLLPRIRAMYASAQIDRATVHHLTLASKRQQKAWLAIADDDAACLPTGHRLKAWLFGGQSIAVRHALFDVAASGLATVVDLFGEDAYFADADAFWTAQTAAIEARRAAFLADGWADALVVPAEQHFATWEYEKAGKRKGGRVYLDVRSSGEVVVHEGYVSRKDAARIARGEADGGTGSTTKPVRSEVSATLQTYIDLHRHAAVRAALTGHPGIALRLMVAHAIVGTHLFRTTPEPQSTRDDDVRQSVENSNGEAGFDERRRAVLGLLGFDEDAPTVVGGNRMGRGTGCGLVGVFHRLLDLPDPAVMDVIAVVIGETLASGSAAVAAVGIEIGVSMASWWTPDPAFLDLIRDREVLTRIVAEVAGETVAAANAAEKGRTLKRIISDHLEGEGARAKVEGWVPRWMAFPPSAYTARGGVGSVIAHAQAMTALRETAARDDEPDPDAPAAVPAVPVRAVDAGAATEADAAADTASDLGTQDRRLAA